MSPIAVRVGPDGLLAGSRHAAARDMRQRAGWRRRGVDFADRWGCERVPADVRRRPDLMAARLNATAFDSLRRASAGLTRRTIGCRSPFFRD